MSAFDSAFADVHALAGGVKKTQVLVLATPHLHPLGERFRPTMLDKLIGCLKHFAPAVIAVESMPPFLIAAMELAQGHYAEILKVFATKRLALGRRAQQMLSLSYPEAEARANARLNEVGNDKLSGRDRADLVLLLLSAYDLYAALLQWQAMSPRAREDTDLLPIGFATELDAELATSNERVTLELRLAHELGHSKLAYIDDHQDATLYFTVADRLEPELAASGHPELVRNSPVNRSAGRLLEDAVSQGDLFPFYQHVNSGGFAREVVNLECGAYLQTKLPSGLDRARLAQWEVRNLNMAARIRQASALHPGGRLLTTVGYSHKPMLDRYLSQMIDVELIHLEDVCN